jgi:hypothetical protein
VNLKESVVDELHCFGKWDGKRFLKKPFQLSGRESLVDPVPKKTLRQSVVAEPGRVVPCPLDA